MKKIFLFIILLTTLLFCHEKNSHKKIPHTKNNYYRKAGNFRDKKISDSAFYYYNLAKDEYVKANDSIGAAESLINMAIIQTNYGDFFGSIETSLEANTFLKNENDSITKRDLASNYNNMGIASSFLYNHDRAVNFYKNAIKYSNSGENKFIYYNNLGNALISKKYPRQAQKYLNYAVLANDHKNQSRAINNLARAKLLENKHYDPLPEFYKALKIREEDNDLDGLNSSFATLADYFFERDNEKSLMYAKKMLQTASEINNPEDQLQALQKIITIDKNNYQSYFAKFQTINDSIQIARNEAKNQFAYFRYGIEKEKAENQKLKADQIQKENHILKQRIGLGTLSLLLISGLFWYRRRKKRLQKEKELEVKNTELKLSKKVHDVVANGIYQVMTKIENQKDFDKEEALDELEFVYEKSRDISYEKANGKHNSQGFGETISGLIGSFNNDYVKTYVAGNDKTIWKEVSESTFDETYQIIRELLVNMKKHSKASIVSFRFERIDHMIKIYYTDNGIGIPGDLIYKNGLSNTDSRIETVHGEIIFDTKIEKGLKINISFPVS
ncbi:MAG: hypothetical protein MUW56_09705 [Chryseobacterium sp.]|uniref:tetratricopeptide repeat-containing sensor histidine kinase n=1 Tax=Chryseobacterium sp. TaxID=1871047 RepID=UPI0025C56CE6|nr:hypothetical protein [Chryseobacterium sp.]MCJ7933892.1 hypothetical protein [Chryseobacterium sp.]